MNLEDLKKEMPYKWRVQSFSEYKPQAACVAYIDARDAMDRFDDVCGAENWQDDYKETLNNLLGGIGIKVDGEWTWKWDTGTESQVEKDKGHFSDAFKRAGVKWGVGRFLYALDIVYLPANEVKTKNPVNYPHVVDRNGKRVWNITKHINSMKKNGGKEDTTGDIAKRAEEEKEITATSFSGKMAEYKRAFDGAGRLGAFKKYLKDEYGTDNEVEIVKNYLPSARTIINGLNDLYKKGKK